MTLPGRLRISDSLLQDVFGLLYELPMQIDGVAIDSADRVVFSKNVIRGLFVVLGRELMIVPGVLLTCQIPQPVILCFGTGAWAMIKGWRN